MAVEVGLVDGATAATTPKGSAISTTRRSSSRRSTPTVFIGRMKSVHGACREEVLADLVGTDPVAGLLDGGGREILGMLGRRRGHGADDSVDLLLVELRQRGSCFAGPYGEIAGLLRGTLVEARR